MNKEIARQTSSRDQPKRCRLSFKSAKPHWESIDQQKSTAGLYSVWTRAALRHQRWPAIVIKCKHCGQARSWVPQSLISELSTENENWDFVIGPNRASRCSADGCSCRVVLTWSWQEGHIGFHLIVRHRHLCPWPAQATPYKQGFQSVSTVGIRAPESSKRTGIHNILPALIICTTAAAAMFLSGDNKPAMLPSSAYGSRSLFGMMPFVHMCISIFARPVCEWRTVVWKLSSTKNILLQIEIHWGIVLRVHPNRNGPSDSMNCPNQVFERARSNVGWNTSWDSKDWSWWVKFEASQCAHHDISTRQSIAFRMLRFAADVLRHLKSFYHRKFRASLTIWS